MTQARRRSPDVLAEHLKRQKVAGVSRRETEAGAVRSTAR